MKANKESLGQKLKRCIKGLLLTAVGMQIVLGLIWLGGSFGSMQFFSVSMDYVQAAENLTFHGYSGILYVLLTAAALWLQQITGISYYQPLYIIQVAVFLWAAYFFVCCMKRSGGTKGKLTAIFGALFLCTVPMLMQCHLAVRPQSLVVSVFLVMLGLCKRAADNVAEINGKLWIVMGTLWMVLSLLLPEYLYLGAVPVTGLLVISFLKKGKILKSGCLVLLVFLVVTCMLNAAVLKPAADRIERKFESAMVSRLVWPWFNQSYYFWPEEIKAVMSPGQALLIDADAEAVQRDFGPMVEQAYGKERALQLYAQMAKASLEVRTKDVLHEMWEDLKAYICTPLGVYGQLRGAEQISYSGWNYKNMSEQCPQITRPYVFCGFGLWFAEIFCFAGVVVRRLLLWKKEGESDKEKTHSHAFFWIAGLCVLSQAVWYTMSGAGMMDYLNVPVITVLWYALPIYLIFTPQRGRDID